MTDWPEYRFAPNRDGFNPFETGLNAGNVRGLRERWRADVGGPDWQATAPTVAGDRVFTTSASLGSGGSDGALYALDDQSGSVVWRVELGGSALEASSTVAGDLVLVGVTDASFTSRLRAFGAVDGSSRWSVPVESEPSSPAVVDRVAYVATRGPSPAVHAVAVADGSQRWRTDLPGAVIGGAPAVADGAVFVVTELGDVVALEVADGTARWQVPFSGLVHRGPVVVDGRVHVGDDAGHLAAFDASSGGTIWRAAIPAGEMGIAVAYGRVYVAKGSVAGDAPTLLAVDAATGGDPLWSTLRGTGIAGPTVANGVVYVGDTAGSLYGFDAMSGGALWSPKALVRNQFTNFDEIVVRDTALYTSNLNGSNGFVVKFTLPFRPLAGWWWSRYRFKPQPIQKGDPPPPGNERQINVTR